MERLMIDRGLAKALEFVRAGDCLVVWKLDRLCCFLSHLLTIVTGIKEKGVVVHSLTEQKNTTRPHGALLFHLLGRSPNIEKALIQERIKAGISAAKHPLRHSGRPRVQNVEMLEFVLAALESRSSKASICSTFGIPRSTLINSLA
jgi:DNA invertase Pin-like site-specific DNA recombinase